MDAGEGSIYGYFCYAMAIIASILSMLPTFASWHRRALGPGDRFPDPMIAALLGNATWFAFGLIEKSKEAAWLNGTCGVLQMINLLTYIVLCTRAKRIVSRNRLCGAAAYLLFTVWIGVQHDSVHLYKVFCALPAAAAAFAPIFTTVYVDLTMRKTTNLLPKWYVSAFSIFNALIWVARGVLIWEIPMAFQNACAAFCSAWLLALLFVWEEPYPPFYPENDDSSSSDDDDDSSSSDDDDDSGPDEDDDNSGPDDDDDDDDNGGPDDDDDDNGGPDDDDDDYSGPDDDDDNSGPDDNDDDFNGYQLLHRANSVGYSSDDGDNDSEQNRRYSI